MADALETTSDEAELKVGESQLADLLPALQRLDRLLERAVAVAQAVYGREAAADPYRGLYIHRDEVDRLLAREPGAPTLQPERTPSIITPHSEPERQSEAHDPDHPGGRLSFWVSRWRYGQSDVPEVAPLAGGQPDSRILTMSSDPEEHVLLPTFTGADQDFESTLLHPAGKGTRLAWLAQVFDLSLFDLDLLLIALAPELDLRYERLYAYLQDDVTRRRPSVDLALNLLCTSADAKLTRRSHFATNAPLIRHRLLHLIPDPNQIQPPFPAYHLKLDEQITRFLLGQVGLDRRLLTFCQLVEPALFLDELPLFTGTKQALGAMVSQARETHQPIWLHFHGQPGTDKRRTAEALANKVDMTLLAVDLANALTSTIDFEQILKLIFREAWIHKAILYLDDMDALRGEERAVQYQRLLTALTEDSGITILAGVQPWLPPGRGPIGVINVPFPIPDFAQRRECWQANLEAAGITLDAPDLDALADRFRLTPHQITDAVNTARNHVRWQAAATSPEHETTQLPETPTIIDLYMAARAQTGHSLAALANKIEPKYIWDDIVLPSDQLDQLREICNQAKYRQVVYIGWGFERKLSLGKGLNVLFSGPPGTGKTMAAEIIANELQLDLYKIDLSQVVSKYIGETEKNLDRIFTVAENANAILFFDEADALFGKRSEVRDSHDRYANIEISYLLQKMEQYEGIAILATNLRRNLDEAFVRRLAFTVHFPFPDEASRRAIWAGIWPAETPLDDEVDLDFMARQFKLSGGNIKNVALAAAFMAAANGRSVTMVHLVQATKREYQKMGKPCTETEFGPYFHLLESGGGIR